jgi:hypothetical protein
LCFIRNEKLSERKQKYEILKTGFLDFWLYPAPDLGGEILPAAKPAGQAPVLAAFYEEVTDLADELPSFLGKILAAAAPDLPQQAALIKLTKGTSYSFSRLARSQSLKYVLIFGLAPKDLGLHFALTPYRPVDFGGLVFILAHSLAAIYEERQQGGKQMSGELWRALKGVFQQS